MDEYTDNINFSDEEKCRQYLETKFDDLLQGINNLYGNELREELLQRLSDTIEIFHRDISELLQELKQEREPDAPQDSPSTAAPDAGATNKTGTTAPSAEKFKPKEGDWERHLKE